NVSTYREVSSSRSRCLPTDRSTSAIRLLALTADVLARPSCRMSIPESPEFSRRTLLSTAMAWVLASHSSLGAQWASSGGALTKERRDRLSPREVIEELKKGNERFRTGRTIARD